MKRKLWVLAYLVSVLVLIGCSRSIKADEVVDSAEGGILAQVNQSLVDEDETTTEDEEVVEVNIETLRNQIIQKFHGITPTQWGEKVDGVINRIETMDKVIALTFDACGGGKGLAYDEKLIKFLIEENVPATLFISGGWIDYNREILKELASNPLFEIANHGHNHKPLSVEGRVAYNIIGTSSLMEAFDEIYINQQKIYDVTGKMPSYFRSGTAYYDEVAVQLLEELGLKAINYNVLGDAGATFSKEQIVRSMMSSKEGAIILFHMNKPNSSIAEGVKEGVLKLRDKGFTFVHLREYHDLLRE